MVDASPGSLWRPEGEQWVATALSRGPWDPRHCNGGPVAAMLAHAAEAVVDEYSAGVDWHVSRLTAELIHPVPVDRPLTVRSSMERSGHSVSLVSVVMSDDEHQLALARALRIRHHDTPLPDGTVQLDDRLPAPVDGVSTPPEWPTGDQVAFHSDAITFQLVAGRFDQVGPATAWIHLDVDVVPNNAPTALQRVAAACDTGNGLSNGLPNHEWRYLNADLSIHLARPLVGEWVGLAASSAYGAESVVSGAGFAECAIYDIDGRFGRSVQSLYIDHR
ncbi:MAG: acyl-CoA thioesterase domain-containing protein [Actinomycetota bacterium]